MTGKDLRTQLATYGQHHRSEQPRVDVDEIVRYAGNGESSPSEVDPEWSVVRAVPISQAPASTGSGINRRSWVAAAAVASVAVMVSAGVWLGGPDDPTEPADVATESPSEGDAPIPPEAFTGGGAIPSEAAEGNSVIPDQRPAHGPVVADTEQATRPGGSAATGGTPLPDLANATLADDGGPPLPLGTVSALPAHERLDFLFEFCWDGCFRDAHFMDPVNPDLGSGPWTAGRPFHIRHGFVNEGPEPLGPGFDVAVYVFSMDEPGEFGGVSIGNTSRYTTDYVIQGESEACGPDYKTQDGSVTCEWFVHDFPDGLPGGRFALWAFWEAPCSAWVDLGMASECADPSEVLSLFQSGVDSPFDGSDPQFIEQNQAQLSADDLHTHTGPFDGGPPDLGPPIDASGAVANFSTTTPDFVGAVPGDDGSGPLPLGEVQELPGQDHLNFLFEFCPAGCYRDAHFMDPKNPEVGSGPWTAGRAFHVRHGFPSKGDQPLGSGFDVVLYVTRMDLMPGEYGGTAIGQTVRYTSDFVLRGESEACGPTYKSQTGPVTCEWFVHDFPDGLPAGRYDLWAVWEAPCHAWVDYGFTESCGDPDAVMSLFSSGVNSPFDSGPPSFTERNEG